MAWGPCCSTPPPRGLATSAGAPRIRHSTLVSERTGTQHTQCRGVIRAGGAGPTAVGGCALSIGPEPSLEHAGGGAHSVPTSWSPS